VGDQTEDAEAPLSEMPKEFELIRSPAQPRRGQDCEDPKLKGKGKFQL